MLIFRYYHNRTDRYPIEYLWAGVIYSAWFYDFSLYMIKWCRKPNVLCVVMLSILNHKTAVGHMLDSSTQRIPLRIVCSEMKLRLVTPNRMHSVAFLSSAWQPLFSQLVSSSTYHNSFVYWRQQKAAKIIKNLGRIDELNTTAHKFIMKENFEISKYKIHIHKTQRNEWNTFRQRVFEQREWEREYSTAAKNGSVVGANCCKFKES